MLRLPLATFLALGAFALAHGQSPASPAPVCDPVTSRPFSSVSAITPAGHAVMAGADVNALQLTDVLGQAKVVSALQSSLAPYAHTVTATDGAALLPLSGKTSTDATAYRFGQDFVILRPASTMQHLTVDLPEGVWINYWTGTQILGGRAVAMDVLPGTLPIWARGGAVVPRRTGGMHALRELDVAGNDASCGSMCLFDVMPGFTGDQAETTHDADGRTLTRTRSSLRIDGTATRAIIRWRYARVQDVRVNGSPVRPQESEEGYYVMIDHAESTTIDWTPRGYNLAVVGHRNAYRR